MRERWICCAPTKQNEDRRTNTDRPKTSPPDTELLLARARTCLELECNAIRATAEALDERFAEAVELVGETLLARNKLIFTGVGKNVHICQKIIGTFNSTGAPACFLDPMQALHGDLGLCAAGDLVFLISNSGETEELIALFPVLKRLAVRTVAITAVEESELASHCDLTLTYRAEVEACPLNLAPTASTTAALALGDALAMVYLEVRGLSEEDFARFHPAGNLGKRLLLRVGEIMRSGNRFAQLPETCIVQEALMAITRAKCGTIALTDPRSGRLTGVFSDGDFRRGALDDPDFIRQKVAAHMTRNPVTIARDALAVDALRIFENSRVNDIIVVDAEGRPTGLVDGQDLPKLKLV